MMIPAMKELLLADASLAYDDHDRKYSLYNLPPWNFPFSGYAAYEMK